MQRRRNMSLYGMQRTANKIKLFFSKQMSRHHSLYKKL